MSLPKHEYRKQPDDALTVAEFIDYLNALAEVHEDTARDFPKPVFGHSDFARMLRRIAKWRP